MANVTVSSLILFIASMTLAVGVAGTLVTNVSQISQSIDERSVGVSAKIETDIEVISDAGSDGLYNDTTDELTLLVKNTGARTLVNDTSAVTVLVDGQFVKSANLSMVVIEHAEWRQGSVARLTIQRSLDGGSHRVVVRVNEDEEVFEFNL